MDTDEIAAFSRYLRSIGYTTRTTTGPNGVVTRATQRQWDHVQVYSYPVPVAVGGKGIACADYFVSTVHSDGSWWTASNVRREEISRMQLWRQGPQGVVDNTGGNDYWGPDTWSESE